MFKSASFFRISDDFVMPPLDALEEALQAARFMPCGATQPESSGWVPPRGKKGTVMVESINRQVILQLCTERRPLPASAVKADVEERIEKYKQETGNERVPSKIKKEFKEEAIQSLLPRAFTKRSQTTLWIDPVNKFLVVDSGSLSGADRVISQLVETLSEMPGGGPGIMARPVQTTMAAGASMAHWLASREAPVSFTVDRDCELKMPDDQKSTVRYSRHTLEIDEVAQHIASGKVPTQLGMTWNDRVSLVLTDMAQVRKIKLLDVVLDGVKERGKDDDGFDTDVAIITGELSAMIPDLLEALGGELVIDGNAPAPTSAPVETVKRKRAA
ncbi:recombination-associated protein RdgC [Polaromonas sp.]|jgi:recombination associated protein RdgC|uniref:recombination-associated protein RdgC n=1 Tax=Polaromonas sp. TaxID=1869339 RepID=UPI001DC403E0|nr:recombination-associated protein RdgC [Polaromonas sp.]MBT9477710.1 recombination-associated protein RdgC [Polaromonas sp.]